MCLMEIYLGILVFVFGLLIGSFLNVVLYRMHTGKSLSGHSHCLSCNTQLRWYELFPLFSYLALRARCRSCSAYIPLRYFLVELLTALLFLWTWFSIGELVLLGLSIVLMSVLVLIVVYDIRHTIIPDELTIAVLCLAVAVGAYDYWLDQDIETLLWRTVGALLASGFFGLLWGLSKGRWMGFGDVKLVFPLALLVGLWGVFSLVVLAFWIGAAISLGLMCVAWLSRRVLPTSRLARVSIRFTSEVPFAPFLITAFLFVYLSGVDILELLTYAVL